MLRSILKVTLNDQVKMKTIMKKTGAKEIWVAAKKQKLKYAGHTIKWSKTLTTWIPHKGKRRVEKPTFRRSDELVKNLGPNWQHIAKDTREWNRATEAYGRKWAAEVGARE